MEPNRWREIEELCQTALDQAEAERASFLDRACAGDEALRREVESLLKHHETAETFIEAPALEVAAKMAAADQARSLVGHEINHYRILSLLGAGGMGRVYLAEDINLSRRVALKLLPAEPTRNSHRVLRFKQEARVISALNHPNIITIYEVGEIADMHYIATEFIDGQTLRQHMTGGTMQIGDVVGVATQVASALGAAHDSGIVHRDIKPENIMVRKDGLVKVLDFGVAKLTESQTPSVDSWTETKDGANTQTGALMGTVRYMSPEQARGVTIDARSDIFSLGVVLHEMLAGKSPFGGTTTTEVITAILGDEPPPIISCRPEVPKELEQILAHALHKDAAERYQTTQQMLADLKELKQRLEIEAVLEKTQAASAPRREKRSFRKWGTATAGLLLVFVTSWRLLPNRNGAPAEDAVIMSLAILPLENLSGDPDRELFVDGMTEELSSTLGQIGNLRVPGRTSVMRYKGTKKSLAEIASELKVDALVKGALLESGGKVRITVRLIRATGVGEDQSLWVGNYDRDAQDVLTLQNEVARDIARETRIQLSPRERERLARAQKVDPKAHNLYVMGRQLWNKSNLDGYSKAISYFREAQDLAPTYAAPSAGLADTYLELASTGVLQTAFAYDEARKEATRALELDPELADAHVSLALMDYIGGDWIRAENLFNRALVLNPNYSHAHMMFAHFLASGGRFTEAMAEAKLARDLDHGSLAMNFMVAFTYYLSRQYTAAIEAFQHTLDLDPEFSSAQEALAKVYEMAGMPDKAFAEYQKYLTSGGVPLAEVSAFERVYRSAGIRAYLEKLLDREVEEERLGYGVWPIRRASLHARLGDAGSTVQWLERAFRERSPILKDVRVDPVYDSVRKDPRFIKFVERLQLPPMPGASSTQR